MSPKMLRLAIVDDDSAIVSLVEHMVNQHLAGKFQISTFADPRDAKNWISQHDCDVLISDVEMPTVGGLELMRTAVARNPGVQTILLTAHSAWDRIAAAIEFGASDYLLKPVHQRDLIGRLRRQHEQLSRGQCPAVELPTNDSALPAPAV
jgi:DNA-binding NtrC family response regulator